MVKNRQYIDLNTIYKDELVSETYTINKIRLTKDEVRFEKMRSAINGVGWLKVGLKSDFDYINLIKKGEGVMMSDTPMERNSNRYFLQKANGDVLIFGLGLGLIVFPLINDELVKSITVVELYQDLIDLVEPKIKDMDTDGKVKIIKGDAFTHELPKGQLFDTIYFDIWLDINPEDYNEHKKLKNRYRKHLNKVNPSFFMDAWLSDHHKTELAREKRMYSLY